MLAYTVFQIAATVLCLSQVTATVHSVPALPSTAVTAPNPTWSDESIAACNLDTLPIDCLTAISRRAGPRPTLALRLTSKSLSDELKQAEEEHRQYWLEHSSIRAAFPAVHASKLEIIDEVPADAFILGAFSLSRRKVMRIGNRFGLRYYRRTAPEMPNIDKLLVLDRNLNRVFTHECNEQDIVTSATSDVSPYYCVKDNHSITFHDLDTGRVIYQFKCEDVVAHSGDLVLCNRYRNEMRLFRIDFQAQEHRCLWNHVYAPVRYTKSSVHEDVIVQECFPYNGMYLRVLHADSGELLWQTSLHTSTDYSICVSESVLTIVLSKDSEHPLIKHYDLHTGRLYEKDPNRANEMLQTVSENALIIATDEFMIWYIQESQSLIIIDFVLGTISISQDATPTSIGVAFRESAFGPIRVKLVDETDLF